MSYFTDTDGLQKPAADMRVIPASVMRPLLLEGDSYMTATGNGAELIARLIVQTNSERYITSTAVSGSTLDAALARLQAEPDVVAKSTTVIWDGDPNSYSTPTAYLAVIDSITALTGLTNLLIVRPTQRGPSSDGSVSQTTLDMETIMAGMVSRGIHCIDPIPIINSMSTGTAQDLKDISARVVIASQLQGDLTHLLTGAKQLMATIIGQTLISLGI